MEPINESLIAPCGMNCGICQHYLRVENKCPGCNTGRKVNNRPIKCSRRLCQKRKGKFCYECDSFPCDSLKRLDERYKKNYDMSEIKNLECIRDCGMEKFLESERQKYQKDGSILCIHDKKRYPFKEF